MNANRLLGIALIGASMMTPIACEAYTAPDPLDMCWTFGAHEPYTMYRRMGVRSTGGIHGNSHWLPDWFRWWDSEACPKQMEELGLNWLLCRFYKGMGWQEEKKDFPNVQRFVANCRKHGIKPIAYVQFLTLYPETMKREIPDLESWAAVRANGTKYYYGNYFRWFPCFNNPKFEEYLKKIISIALTEAEFEGVFFDNAFTPPCYCARCRKLFHEHLQTIKNPADRFGFDSLADFDMPEYPGYRNPSLSLTELPWGEIREPLLQEFNLWRAKRMTELFRRFYDYAHSVKRDCVVAANTCPYRAPCTVEAKSVDMTEFPKCFDLVMGQVDNCPHMEPNGVIVNRVRDLKYAREFAATYFASCDGAAGDNENEVEASYLLPMIEDLVFGGVPADRTIMAPYADPSGGFVNRARLERRRPQLLAFQRFAKEQRKLFAAKDWMPVRFVVSSPAMAHSQAAHFGLLASEAAALRGHIPFGYSISTEAEPLPHADETEVMIVANQTCLSDRQIAALVEYAKRGGRLVCIGESGRYDEWNRQRHRNPLKEATKTLSNVSWRDRVDVVKAKRIDHIKYALHRPEQGPTPLVNDVKRLGWRAPFAVVDGPETVFAQYKTDGKTISSVHLVNYVFTEPARGVRLRVPDGVQPIFTAPFDDASVEKPREVLPNVWEMPSFVKYAYVTFTKKTELPGVKISERFGYDAKDSTKFLQAALDSGLPKLILDRQAGPWYTLPLYGHSNQTIVFEDGAEICALRGKYLGLSDSLLTYRGCSNVVLRGKGKLRMWRDDYDRAPYAHAEWRMGLSLLSCEGVLIDGLTISESGGDGIYLGANGRENRDTKLCPPPNRHITIRNCVLDKNYRQGISVISARDLIIEHCALTNTKGTPPQAGIDFEPNHYMQPLADCILRDCVITNNAGSAIEIVAIQYNAKSEPLSIRIENCRSHGNHRYGFLYMGARQDPLLPVDDGRIEVVGCSFNEDRLQAAKIERKLFSSGKIAFNHCRFDSCGQATPKLPDFNVRVSGHEIYPADSIAFNDVTIRQTQSRDWLSSLPNSIYHGTPTQFYGSLKVEPPNGDAKTIQLDAEWNSKRHPSMPGTEIVTFKPVAFTGNGANPVDKQPGKMVKMSTLNVRGKVRYLFYAAKAGKMNFTAQQRQVGRRQIEPIELKLSSLPFRKQIIDTVKFAAVSRPTPFSVTVPQAGFYQLAIATGGSGFNIVAADVPLALDASESSAEFIYPTGECYFAVKPGERFGLCGSGEGSENFSTKLYDSAGKCALNAPNCLDMVRYASPSCTPAGLWRIRLDRPNAGTLEDGKLQLTGIPGVLFLSNEKYW